MPRILIFEDNENFRRSLVAVLATVAGFEVVGDFGDCQMLEERVKALQPDIVLLDIDMPNVDGLQGLYLLKQNFPEVRALMLTIFDDNEQVFQAVCLGADGYLLKHTPPHRIIEAIDDAIAGGLPMSPAVARKVFEVFQRGQFQKPNDYNLTEKEREVLTLLVDGNSYKMIATKQFVSVNTIQTQVRSIYAKLRVHSVSEAVVKAIREQIV